jgi:hypothetical protein
MLSLIWISSLILSALSLVIMCVLIVRRLFVHHRLHKQRRQHEALLAALIAFTVDGNEGQLRHAVSSVSPRVALEAGFEFLALVRGDEHTRIVAVLADAGIVEEVVRLVKRGNESERIQAAEMLAAFGGDEAAGVLLQAFGRDRSTEVRIAAAIALCLLGRLPALGEVLAAIGTRGQRSGRMARFSAPARRRRHRRGVRRRHQGHRADRSSGGGPRGGARNDPA